MEEVSKAILDLLTDNAAWETCSKNGLQNVLAYSWPSHCIQYLEFIEKEKQLTNPGKGRLIEQRHSLDDNDIVYYADKRVDETLGQPGSATRGGSGGQFTTVRAANTSDAVYQNQMTCIPDTVVLRRNLKGVR